MPKKEKTKISKTEIDPEEIIIGLNTKKQKDNPPKGKKKAKKVKKKTNQKEKSLPKKTKKRKKKKKKGRLKKVLKILLKLIIVIRNCSRYNYILICITSIQYTRNNSRRRK